MPRPKLSLGIKFCLLCNKVIHLKIKRDLIRKKYCSYSCRQVHKIQIDFRYKKNLNKGLTQLLTGKYDHLKGLSGSSNPRWIKNRSKIKSRSRYENSEWKKQILKRDNYTCKICLIRGGKLQVDHIKPYSLYPNERWNLNNGRTLCINCHKKTDTYGSKIFKYLKGDINGTL